MRDAANLPLVIVGFVAGVVLLLAAFGACLWWYLNDPSIKTWRENPPAWAWWQGDDGPMTARALVFLVLYALLLLAFIGLGSIVERILWG